jgi:hypothetical protein
MKSLESGEIVVEDGHLVSHGFLVRLSTPRYFPLGFGLQNMRISMTRTHQLVFSTISSPLT